MRAALFQHTGRLDVVDDVDLEDPRPDEVKVRVTHCGICHSDLTMVDLLDSDITTSVGSGAGASPKSMPSPTFSHTRLGLLLAAKKASRSTCMTRRDMAR